MRFLNYWVLTLFLASSLPAQGNKATANDVPGSLPGIRLVSPLPTGEWTMPSGDYANTRFSPLSQINTGNVKNLHITGMMSTGIPHGHEGGPLVVNKTMYVVTPFPNYLIALDLTKPGYPMKWKFEPDPDQRSVGIACCDTVNRGASYADGKVIYNTLGRENGGGRCQHRAASMEDYRRRYGPR